MTAPRTWRDWMPPPGTRSTPRETTAVPKAGGTRAADAPPMPTPAPVNKFHAERRAAHDGTILDSAHEARIYEGLWLRARAGDITDLRRQVRIPLDVNGKRVCAIKVDFVYHDVTRGCDVYLEAKSPVTRTRQYVISRKLFEALTGIQVEEA
jgi:hypothetical protein